jgi:hypothetical protein
MIGLMMFVFLMEMLPLLALLVIVALVVLKAAWYWYSVPAVMMFAARLFWGWLAEKKN